jgi:hypothetical protein
MPDRHRNPTPWEAAQLPPPRGWLRRTWMAARIRWTAATTRPPNAGKHRRDRGGNERPYGGPSNG